MTSQHYLRKNVLNFLLKSQWFNREELEDLQLQGLKSLTRHARQNVPFYKDLPIIRDVDDLKQIPILTKKDIHDNFKDLIAPNIKARRKWTGGTSEQVVIMQNTREPAILDASNRFESWYPKESLRRRIVVWGAEQFVKREVKPYVFKFNIGNASRYMFPIEKMSNEKTIVKYLKLMRGWKPTSLRTYASVHRLLAYYALKHNIKLPTLKVVINNCEPLTSDIRKLVMEAFELPMFDFYGSQDLGSMAQDCNKHEGMHLNMERYILEVMKDRRFIWTDLMNYAMPLIRYENGDEGKLSNRVCSCGRGLILFDDVVGRTLQYLWTKQNEWLNVTDINEVMYFLIPNYLDLIEAHQIQQDEQGKAILLLKAWGMEKLPDMSIVQKYFADRIDIEIRYVYKMVRSPSNKQLACITKFKPPWINKNEWEIEGIESRADKK